MKNQDKPENLFKKLQGIKNDLDRPVFNSTPENYLVNIKPDTSISKGNFKPHPILRETYIAHPVTIRALKKDIFMAGDEFIDFENIIICESCKTKLDKQFWKFCPICESSFGQE